MSLGYAEQIESHLKPRKKTANLKYQVRGISTVKAVQKDAGLKQTQSVRRYTIVFLGGCIK